MDIDELIGPVAFVFQRNLDYRIVLADFDIDILLDRTDPSGSIDLNALDGDIVLSPLPSESQSLDRDVVFRCHHTDNQCAAVAHLE